MSEDDWTVTFQLPYGEWIRLFSANELVVEDLIEDQPPVTATSTYDVAPLKWARRWPAETLWKVRRRQRVPGARARSVTCAPQG